MNQVLKIGNLEAKVPIVQGGMGIGISLGNLAGHVAKEGAVGIISAAQIGYREPDFDQHTKEANLRAIASEYKKAKEIAPNGIIGFNLMVAMRHYEEYVKAVVDTGADLIVSGAGLPMDLPKYAEGSDTKLAPIISSLKAAKIIIRYWEKKYQRIPDLLVVEGPKAGGHLGFSRDELIRYETESYQTEIENILAYVKPMGIPVVVGGGISTREDVNAMLELGADGVQIATRFVTTEECDADMRYKETYLKAQKEDIVITKSPVGMPGRAIRNAFLKRVENGEQIPHTPCHGCLAKCNPKEIPYCITDALIAAAKGNVEQALLFCGADAYKAKKLQKVKEVIDSLV